MAADQYVVAQSGERWVVRLNRRDMGSFLSRAEAVKAAIISARTSGEAGIAAEVLSEAESGELYPIWTYGEDGYSEA